MEKLLSLEEPIGSPLKGIGPLGLEAGIINAGALFSKFISSIIGIMTIIAIIWFILILITGAIGIMTAGGDKASLENAKKRITNGIIGLIVLIAALFILVLIGYLIGLDLNTILSPERFIESVWGP